MRRFGVILASCLCAFALAGCATSELSGTVISESSRQPLADVIVVVESESTTTSADGMFLIEGLEQSETATVTLRREGFPDYETTATFDAEPQEIAYPDSILRVSVVELAVEPSEVASASVVIASTGATLTAEADSIWVSAVLPTGPETVTVSAAGHEEYSAATTLVAGSNEMTAAISLTPESTYRRYSDTEAFHRSEVAYKYLHPDQQENMPYAEFSEASDDWETVSMDIHAVRMLDEWTSTRTGKTYSTVAEIDRTLVLQNLLLGETTKKGSQHWIKIDGIWYVVFVGG